MVKEAIVGALNEDTFQIKCEPILQTLESRQANWVPFKVKKQVADVIKDVVKAAPSEHSAQQKLFALKLLNKLILLNNKEFNRYVENILMPRLQILAQFNPSGMGDDLVSETSSMKQSRNNSAQEMLKRGETMFGPHEKDR